MSPGALLTLRGSVSGRMSRSARDVDQFSVEMRKCKFCGQEKPLVGNFPNSIKKGTITWSKGCRKCWAERKRKRRLENIEVARAKERAYQHRNREKINASSRASFARRKEKIKLRNKERKQANPEKFKVQSSKAQKLYWKRHPERVLLQNRRRHARKKGVLSKVITEQQIFDLHVKQRGRCAICRKLISKWHTDHIVPLAKDGPHEIKNIQLLCQPCNQKKYSSDPIDHMQKLGFLL
jgi:hypothetical protein